MGLAVTFWPFGGKEAGADTEAGVDADGVEATPALRQRLQAWWDGSGAAPKPAADSDPDADSNAISALRQRLQAWWDGHELKSDGEPAPDIAAPAKAGAGDAADEASEKSSTPIDLSPIKPEQVWSKERLELVQLLWGDGYIWPGGLDYVHELVNGLGLTPKVSMVEIGTGMGAGSRAVVDKFGTYVTAVDRHPELVEEARNQNTVHDVSDKVKVNVFDPGNIKLKEKYFEAAVVRDTLFQCENRKDLLKDIIWSIKTEGQIMITDFLFDEDDDSEALRQWKDAEPEPVYPWSVADIKQVLSANNVVMRIAEDESDAYRAMVLNTWGEFLYKLKSSAVSDDLMGTMLWEAELWALRIAALDSGALRFYRILGVKNG